VARAPCKTTGSKASRELLRELVPDDLQIEMRRLLLCAGVLGHEDFPAVGGRGGDGFSLTALRRAEEELANSL